jgi:hypothetical protein
MTSVPKVESILGESVVEEVRAIREAIDREVGHDIRRLAARAQAISEKIEEEFGLTVAVPPQRSLRT